MAIQKTGNVIFVDAVGTVAVALPSSQARIAAIIVTCTAVAPASVELKVFADQAATAAKQIADIIALGQTSQPAVFGNEPGAGTIHTFNGLFVNFAALGAGGVGFAFIYLN